MHQPEAIVKSFASASFFRLLDLLIGISNPGLKSDQWTIDDVCFERERHSFSGRTHCFVIEVLLISRSGRRGWQLMVAKEYWWDGGHKRTLKTLRWGRPTAGNRRDIIAWLGAQEKSMQRQP